MHKLKFIGLAGMLFIAPTLEAQKMTQPVKAKGYGMHSPTGVRGLSHVGFIGNKEVMVNGSSYKVFEGATEVNKDFLSESFNKNDGVNLYFKPNEVLFIRTDNALEKAPIFIQVFDEKLKPKGQPRKVGELSLTLNSASKGSSGPISKRKVDIQTSWDATTGNTLLSCHVGSYGISITGGTPKSSSTPYVKLFLLDKDFNVISTFAQEASEDGNEVSVISPNVVDNGDAIALISQTEKKSIKSNYLVHLSKDKDAALTEILPDKPSVLSYSTSLNTNDDKVVVSILSQDQKGGDNKCVVGLYNYNLKTKNAERKSYELNLDNIDLKTMPHFKWLNFEEIQILKDGSTLVFLNATVEVIEDGKHYTMSHGLVFMKIKPNGDLAWVRPIEKLDRGYIAVNDMNDVINYINENGNLEVIFNIGKTFLKNGVYKIGNSKGAPWINQIGNMNIPLKVTINLESGVASYNELKFEGKKVTCLYLGESQKLETPGKYIMRLFISGDAHNTVVDFRE